MRWLVLLAALAGCDRVFGLGDPYEDARSPAGSDGAGPGDGRGLDGSDKATALIASFPFDNNYTDAVSQTDAICSSMLGSGCAFGSSHNAAGSSASFDGATCVTFQIPARPPAITIAMWVNATSGATEAVLTRPGFNDPTWLLEEDNDSVYFKSGTASVTGTPGPTATSWHAIAVTVGPGGSVAYLDGVERGSGAGITISYISDTAYIGCDGSTSSLDNFHGLLDNVEIYDGILSVAEIQAIP